MGQCYLMEETSDSVQSHKAQQMRPILIQGAHEPELAFIRDNLSDLVEVIVATFRFWVGNLKLSDADVPVVVSETGIGSALAAAATVVAYQHFNPRAVINQGTML